jgi:hypothetical protein
LTFSTVLMKCKFGELLKCCKHVGFCIFVLVTLLHCSSVLYLLLFFLSCHSVTSCISSHTRTKYTHKQLYVRTFLLLQIYDSNILLHNSHVLNI